MIVTKEISATLVSPHLSSWQRDQPMFACPGACAEVGAEWGKVHGVRTLTMRLIKPPNSTSFELKQKWKENWVDQW